MLLILLCALAAVIVGAIAQKSVIAYGAIGAVAGLLVFVVVAVTSPRPKVPCWTESSGSQIFRAMPFICTAQKKR